jgi:hypothetical protein
VLNCLKPSGYSMYRRVSSSEILDFTHRLCLLVCVLFRVLNKQQLTLANDQLDAQMFVNTFITILYMYMFRAIPCSSSGGQIVSTL